MHVPTITYGNDLEDIGYRVGVCHLPEFNRHLVELSIVYNGKLATAPTFFGQKYCNVPECCVLSLCVYDASLPHDSILECMSVPLFLLM